MKAYPLKYPPDVPAGLVPSTCTGCAKLWWIGPPPEEAGHCMSCGGKLRFSIGVVAPNISGLLQHAKWLRECAAEIAKEGHAGWGNTCLQTAEAIERYADNGS